MRSSLRLLDELGRFFALVDRPYTQSVSLWRMRRLRAEWKRAMKEEQAGAVWCKVEQCGAKMRIKIETKTGFPVVVNPSYDKLAKKLQRLLKKEKRKVKPYRINNEELTRCLKRIAQKVKHDPIGEGR